MAGTLLERELTTPRTGRVRFEIATPEDDAEIRRLLRANPTPGRISLSFERERDYFADAHQPGETKQTIVARDGKGLACVGSCTIRSRFVNGAPRRVGYLGGLRLDSRQAGRFDILRRGYEFFRELQADAPADFYFTSIAGDNQRARQLLERGLPGMPLYEFVGEFVTVLLPTHDRQWQNQAGVAQTSQSAVSRISQSVTGRAGTPVHAEAQQEYNRVQSIGERRARSDAPYLPKDDICGLNRHIMESCQVARLNESNRTYQFAPSWSLDELAALRSLGLHETDFCVLHHKDKVIASAALWDQRSFKQTIIRGYSPGLTLVRPAFNAVAQLLHRTRLPAIGETLANGFVSHLAMRAEETGVLIDLVALLREMCVQRGLELLTLGFAANDPRLATVRANFQGREYRSRLYVVRWPEMGRAASGLDGRFLAPEVALL